MNKKSKDMIYFFAVTIVSALSTILIFDIQMLSILFKIIIFFVIFFTYFIICYLIIYRERCQICGTNLENGFPKEFPKEFRVCCECLKVAKYVYSVDLYMEIVRMKRRLLINHYYRYKDKFDNIFKIKKERLELIKNEC